MGLIEFTLNQGEKVTAEAAAMVYIRGNIKTETRMRKGGFLKSLKAAALGGESFFVNEFIALEDNCKLGLTGNMLGDIPQKRFTVLQPDPHRFDGDKGSGKF